MSDETDKYLRKAVAEGTLLEGWPGCTIDGCDRWPSVGYTLLCNECIKDPDKVALVAARDWDRRMERDRELREISDRRKRRIDEMEKSRKGTPGDIW